MVSVSPLHRRRGVLTSLMRRQLGELAAGGEAVAALWASDPVIYGRYGYGLAAWRQAFTVDSPASAFGPHGRALLAAGGVRPAPGDRPGGGTGGGAAGYSLHRTASSHADFVAAGTVTLQDLAAVTPAACAGLWRHLLDLDLTTTLATLNRPLPDPVAHLLADHRRLRDRGRRAVGQGGRPAAGAGRPRLRRAGGPVAGGDRRAARGERCALVDLALAGRVVEHRPGALAEATRARSWSPAPWCPKVF
jgi:hypothetical protein